jgi:hypothetical protein
MARFQACDAAGRNLQLRQKGGTSSQGHDNMVNACEAMPRP